MFFLRALLEFDLASLEVAVAEPSLNPGFFFPLFLRSSLRASLQPFPCVIFIPTFSQLWVFPEFFDEDDLAFAILLNVSDSTQAQ